jgi:autophagy-related protein 18
MYSRLYELRRGLKRTADIYSLSFSPCGHFLACSSNTETVHVFRLEDKPKDRCEEIWERFYDFKNIFGKFG